MSIDLRLACDLCGMTTQADIKIEKTSTNTDYFTGKLPRGWVAFTTDRVATVLAAGGMDRGPQNLKLVFCSQTHKTQWEQCDHMARAHAGEVYRNKLREMVLEHKGAVTGLAEIDTSEDSDAVRDLFGISESELPF